MDAYDYHEIDKAMSRKMDEIFSDPARHAFYSVYDEDEALDRRGPRGGKIRGRKTICAHCGAKADKHIFVET
jgi:hypothetical protein